jgi:endoglucanase
MTLHLDRILEEMKLWIETEIFDIIILLIIKEKVMKYFLFVLVFIPIVSIAQTATILEKAYPHQSGGIARVSKLSEMQADSIAPDTTGMRNLSSVELAKEMVPGWNVGNSLDATGGETSWGNPLISQQLIDSVKAAGFNAVRIPIAWSSHFSNATTFIIDPAFMSRVEEVVNYVLNDNMYAIINIHWDGGWMQPTYAQQTYVNNRLAIMWQQIAVYFRDYGDHLLFAGMNEVMVTGNYGTPTPEYYTVQNSFNQTFVTTVRSTGGCNVYRHLAVQGFNTNIDQTVSGFKIPTDVTQNRLMVEVHYYDPYDFTINTGSGYVTQWGNNAPKSESWANESWADGEFQKMKTNYIDKGYAVILGEYGVVARLNLGTTALNASFAKYRRYYMDYITRSLERHGLVPFYWDNGGTDNLGMGIFNRSNGAQAYPDIVKAVVDTNDINNTSTSVGMLDLHSNPTTFSLMQNYPNPFNPSTTISFSLPSKSIVSLKVFDLTGKENATIVSQELSAGTYSRQWNAAHMSSGIYFYRLQAGSFTETKKLVLLK